MLVAVTEAVEFSAETKLTLFLMNVRVDDDADDEVDNGNDVSVSFDVMTETFDAVSRPSILVARLSRL